jgi:hypothetical protein
MPVCIRHFMSVMFIIIPLYKFNALVLQAEIVPVGGNVAAFHMTDPAVILYLYAVELVDYLPDFVLWVPVCRFPQSNKREDPEQR